MKPDIPGCTIIAEMFRSPISIIYRAKQDALDRIVLVKVLQTKLQNDVEITGRFQREAKAIARLKHPNIVQIYDYGTTAGVPYFIMEYVDGPNLQDVIQKEKQLNIERTQHIAQQLLLALQFSHKQGVLHRDIKPANILVTDDDFIKITDFGLAIFQQAPEITSHGQIVGTPAYMSPEQAKGEIVDERSDLFSLGATIFEMLTGESLFGGKTISESLHKLLQRPLNLEKIKKIDPTETFFSLCNGLLTKEITDRVPSAKQALNILNGEINKEHAEKNTKNGKKYRNITKILLPIGVIAILMFVISYSIKMIKQTGSENKKMIKTADSADHLKNQLDSLQIKNADLLSPGVVVEKKMDNKKNSSRFASVINQEIIKEKELPIQIDSSQNRQEQIGFLRIQCLPWAHIWIDDESYGETSLNTEIELSNGTHVLKLNNPHFTEFIDTLRIVAGDTHWVTINLQWQFGELQLNVLPWAKVFIDGKFFDDSPIWEPIRLKNGPHKIRLENPAFDIWEQEIFIRAGEKKKLEVTLK